MNEERGPVVGPDRELPLSPELVLVAPELGEHALASERNGRTPPAAAQAAVLPAEAPRAPPPAEAPPAQAAPAQPIEAEVGPVPPEPPAGWRLTVGGAVLILLGALVVLGGGFFIARSVFSGSSTPSVEPVRRDAPAETPPVARTQPSRATRTPVVAAPAPQQRPQPRPVSSPAPARAHKPAAATVRPTAGGGYVLPGGRFQVSSNGRTIVGLTLGTKCAGELTLPPIPIESSGAFAFAGHPAGSPSAPTVRVRGTFTSPTEAHGTTQVSGTSCRAPATSFVARLS